MSEELYFSVCVFLKSEGLGRLLKNCSWKCSVLPEVWTPPPPHKKSDEGPIQQPGMKWTWTASRVAIADGYGGLTVALTTYKTRDWIMVAGFKKRREVAKGRLVALGSCKMTRYNMLN